MSEKQNLFDQLPDASAAEQFQDLLVRPDVRIERIVSQGQTSPASGWYEQDEHEWVLVLQGAAQLSFEDGVMVDLKPGDHVAIEPGRRHRVSWTEPSAKTVWLAVFSR